MTSLYKASQLITAIFLTAILIPGSSVSNAAARVAPSILPYDKPLSRPITQDLVVRMPFDKKAILALGSQDSRIDAATIMESYRSAQVLSPLTRVDLCKAIVSAEAWIPTAETRVVPLYVPLMLALTPARREQTAQGSLQDC